MSVRLKNKKEFKVINPISPFSVLIVNNLENAESFYVNNFGFNIAFKNEWYLHLVSESGIQVAAQKARSPGHAKSSLSLNSALGHIRIKISNLEALDD